jgi:hypothetical protein
LFQVVPRPRAISVELVKIGMREDVAAPGVADEEGDRTEHVVEIVDERKGDPLEIRSGIGPNRTSRRLAQRPIVVDGPRFGGKDRSPNRCTKIDAAVDVTEISRLRFERASLLEGGGYFVSCIDWPCHRLI